LLELLVGAARSIVRSAVVRTAVRCAGATVGGSRRVSSDGRSSVLRCGVHADLLKPRRIVGRAEPEMATDEEAIDGADARLAAESDSREVEHLDAGQPGDCRLRAEPGPGLRSVSMSDLRLRAMTAGEFDVFLARSEAGYAQAHVDAGDWDGEGAVQRAREETQSLLPEGLDTPRMLFVTAEADIVVGRAWVALEQDIRAGAWIFDIEIDAPHRGKGYGGALLAALERLAREHGAHAIGLNVFAGNEVACGLYRKAGYEPTSLHMRKELR